MTRIAEHVAMSPPGADPKDFERKIGMSRMHRYRLAEFAEQDRA